MKPIYITETPGTFRLSFEFNPTLIDVVKRIPTKKWDNSEKVWVVSKKGIYPPGRDARWYVEAFAQWAVQKNYCSNVSRRSETRDVIYEIPPMKEFVGNHYMLLNPYEYQLEGVRYALDNKRCIFGDQPGLGKLQPYSSLIATPSGWMQMGDLKVGDPLFGRDGNVYHVDAIYEHGIKDTYRFTFNDGTTCLAGLEHLWSVRDVNMRRRGQGWKTMTTGELLNRGLEWNMSPSRKKSGRKPVLRWEVPMCLPVKYPHKEVYLHPYIVGALIGDGNLANGHVVLSNPDLDGDIHERIENLLPPELAIKEDRSASCPRYRIINADNRHANRALDWIKQIGLDTHSGTKRIPRCYLYGDIEQRTELLKGLMDTDSSISRNRITYHSINKELCDDVIELIQSLGGQAWIRCYDRRDEGKAMEYQVNVCVRFNPFHTSRKANAYSVKRGNYCSRYIKGIERVGSELSRCIHVTAPDHLYLTDQFIVTHNTLQAICAVVKAHKEAATYGDTFPVLVICPAALKVNWRREFKKFAGIDACILNDNNRSSWNRFWEVKRPDGEGICPVFITNYESLKKFFVVGIKNTSRFTLSSIEFDERVKLFKSVIIDESHKCKSSKTQQSKFVEGICRGKKWIFALTGTPVVNNNTDLIQQLKILGRLEDFGGYKDFVGRFCDGPKQSSNMKELHYRLWRCCFFRREKAKVLTQLPDKMRQYITCEITNRKEYKDAEDNFLKYLRQYKHADDDRITRAMRGEVMVRMGILKEIAARGKVKAVADFIHDVIDGGEKLIMFAYLKEVVMALKAEFPDAVTVTGSDNIAQKQNAVDRFQNDPECKLIILNYKSGGTGLTLTASSRVGFIEFPWTYSDCEQAEDRAHRNGQKNAVNCYYFLGDKTIDEYMYKVIQTKKDIANEVTGTTTQIDEDIVSNVMTLFGSRL